MAQGVFLSIYCKFRLFWKLWFYISHQCQVSIHCWSILLCFALSIEHIIIIIIISIIVRGLVCLGMFFFMALIIQLHRGFLSAAPSNVTFREQKFNLTGFSCSSNPTSIFLIKYNAHVQYFFIFIVVIIFHAWLIYNRWNEQPKWEAKRKRSGHGNRKKTRTSMYTCVLINNLHVYTVKQTAGENKFVKGIQSWCETQNLCSW